MKREFKPKTEKQTTHIDSAEQFARRHEYCIRIGEINAARDRGEYVPANAKAHCDHIEDGMCGTSISAENLRKVNEKLSGRVISQALEKPEKIETPLKRKRGRPRKVELTANPVKSYFCIRCEDWHNEPHEIYNTHMKFKRGRGRPKKS